MLDSFVIVTALFIEASVRGAGKFTSRSMSLANCNGRTHYFTGQKPGVYYEAGFMHGLGRKVIWLVEKQELDKVHFDVRQYNFIVYDAAPDAKLRLYHRIMAVEGKGPVSTDAA